MCASYHMPRDARLSNESALQTTEVRKEPIGLSEIQATQFWALYPAAAPAPEREEAGLERLLRLVLEIARRGRRSLALGALAGIGFGALYLTFADSIFVVKTLLHVERRNSVIREYDEVRPGSSFVATQAEVIQSPEMIADAIRAIGIPEPDDGLLSRLKDFVRSLLPLEPSAGGDPLAVAVLATAPVLQASPVLGTDVMAVTFRTDDPERGVRLLDALIECYRNYVRENETAAHREGLELLRQRDAELGAQISQLSDHYEAQRSQVQLFGDDEGGMSVQRMSLEEHAKARVDARRKRIDLENELDELRAKSDARAVPDPRILQDVVRAESELAQLKATASPRNPAVRDLELRVAGLREQVHQGALAHIDEVEREARAARKSEARVAELYDREWSNVQALESERASLRKLGDEIGRLEDQRKAVLALAGEKELSLLAQGSEHSGTLIRALEAPAIPPTAVWPLTIPVLVACAFVGLLGGFGFAVLEQRRGAARESEPSDFEPTPARLGQPRVPEL